MEVEPHWPALFAKAFTASGAKPKDLLVGAAASGAAGAHVAAAPAAAPAAGSFINLFSFWVERKVIFIIS